MPSGLAVPAFDRPPTMNSPRFRPTARMRSRTCPAPGTGRSTSRSSIRGGSVPASSHQACMSTAPEGGLALVHERAAAFRVIVALEAIADQLLAQRAVDVRRILQDLLDDAFARADGERRVGLQRFG